MSESILEAQVPEISIFAQSYNCYGAHPVFTRVGEYLEWRLRNGGRRYGAAIREIRITLCFPNDSQEPRRTLEELFEQFHRNLVSLPRVVFYRKRERIELTYESHLASAEKAWRMSLTPDAFNAAVTEITRQLELTQRRVKRADEFDARALFRDVQVIAAEPIETAEELNRILEQVAAVRQAVRAAKSPWELLDIDWDEYHPDARTVLDDPFYWDCVDEFAPHGNDTGADLLEAYRAWLRRKRAGSPALFFDRLLEDWDLPAVDDSVTDPQALRHHWETDWESVYFWDEAMIALAFAELKLTSKCDPTTRRRALLALSRELLPHYEGWSTVADRQHALERMQAKLVSLDPSG